MNVNVVVVVVVAVVTIIIRYILQFISSAHSMYIIDINKMRRLKLTNKRLRYRTACVFNAAFFSPH